ncbi:acyltransferase domain-containing protein [Neosynechococcus sphagnicola]|uniref:type I polyketide synthase n=1 Tax=Neosynechococcus sphagnicola TaxID=1501145 RepID=UPI001EF9CAF1|nr:acyltransferase domain-containing protein [Neosynechococcus sphagnicola]
MDGDRIYAVIKSIGTSSDGKGLGLLAPRSAGQVLALNRAYQQAEIDPATITLIEAHGTGMPLGDQTEVQSIAQVFGQRQGLLPHRGLGSVKSMIGHCIPASGAASLIKMALALYHKILPPTLCDQVNPALGIEKTSFYVNTEARPWIHGHRGIPRRAGVNAFGFGGINAHAILEEYAEPQKAAKLLHGQWPTELFIFSGNSHLGLIDCIQKIQDFLQTCPEESFPSLAFELSNCLPGSHRLAIIAKNIDDLQTKLKLVLAKIQETKQTSFKSRNGFYYAVSNPKIQPGKIAFLFPGEGSQYPNMLADLCLYFPQVREWFDRLDETFSETRDYAPSRIIFPVPTGLTEEERSQVTEQLFRMDVATESVTIASLGLHELLQNLGIRSDVMVGHSTGENAALIASGTFTASSHDQLMQTIWTLNQIYQGLETANTIPKGALLAVGAINAQILQALLDEFQGRLHWAMDNCPNQVILFVNTDEIGDLSNRIQALGGICTQLPFDRAYHTPLFKGVSQALSGFYATLSLAPGHTQLYSCATSAPFPEESTAIRSLAAQQWYSRVRFRDTIEVLYEQGVRTFLEVGPSSNLTSFVEDILRGRAHLAIPCNTQRRTGLEQIQHLLAQLFVNGIPMNLALLYRSRELTPVDLELLNVADDPRQKSRSVLNLNMPVMRLKKDFVTSLHAQLLPSLPAKGSVSPPLVSAKAPAPEVLEAVANFPALNRQISVEPSPADPVQSSDICASAILGHFELMQEFLTSQSRVLTDLYAQSMINPPTEEMNVSTGVMPVHTISPSAWPLLGEIVELDSDRLYCVRCFNLQQDLFLHDHTLGGKPSHRHPELMALPVIPFTVSMEALAEAATYLLGGDKYVIGFSEVRGHRWLTLEKGIFKMGIQAQLQPSQGEGHWSVYVQLFQLDTQNPSPAPVFEGYVKLADQLLLSTPDQAIPELSDTQPYPWSGDELYRKGMFHGPRFQGVQHISWVSPQGIEADLNVSGIEDFFSHIQNPVFQTNPVLLDAAAQLVAYWVAAEQGTEFHTFPFYIKAVHQLQPPSFLKGSKIRCRGRISFISDRQIEANYDFLDQSGQIIAQITGLLEAYLRVPPQYHHCRTDPQATYWSEPFYQKEMGLVCRYISPLPPNFLNELGGVIQKVIAHIMLNQDEQAFWYALPEKGSRRNEWLLGRVAAKDALRQWAWGKFALDLSPADIQILATPLGKPLAHCPPLENYCSLPDVSISHNCGRIVAIVADPNMDIGIDLQYVDSMNTDDWLDGAFTPTELTHLEQFISRDRNQTFLGAWCAKEAASKAAGTGLKCDPKSWKIKDYNLEKHTVNVTHLDQSFEVKLFYNKQNILAVCQRLRN